MRCGLALLGYERLRRILSRTQQRAGQRPDIDRIIWALNAAGRTVLSAKGCLPLALSTQYWLNRCGVSTDLKIGVRRDAAGKVEAHAWVERQGEVLIGGAHSLDQYQPLPPVKLWT